MKKPIKQTCKKCNGKMKRSVAIENAVSGIPDFASDGGIVTQSIGGSGKMIVVLKCTKCGWSVYPDA